MPINDLAWSDLSASFEFAQEGSSIGNGTMVCRAARANGNVLFLAQVIFGSSTVLSSGGMTFRLPGIFVPGNEALTRRGIVPCYARDASTGTHYTGVVLLTENVGGDPQQRPTATPILDGGVTNTAPFTWADGDELFFGNGAEAFGN